MTKKSTGKGKKTKTVASESTVQSVCIFPQDGSSGASKFSGITGAPITTRSSELGIWHDFTDIMPYPGVIIQSSLFRKIIANLNLMKGGSLSEDPVTSLSSLSAKFDNIIVDMTPKIQEIVQSVVAENLIFINQDISNLSSQLALAFDRFKGFVFSFPVVDSIPFSSELFIPADTSDPIELSKYPWVELQFKSWVVKDSDGNSTGYFKLPVLEDVVLHGSGSNPNIPESNGNNFQVGQFIPSSGIPLKGNIGNEFKYSYNELTGELIEGSASFGDAPVLLNTNLIDTPSLVAPDLQEVSEGNSYSFSSDVFSLDSSVTVGNSTLNSEFECITGVEGRVIRNVWKPDDESNPLGSGQWVESGEVEHLKLDLKFTKVKQIAPFRLSFNSDSAYRRGKSFLPNTYVVKYYYYMGVAVE